MVDKKQIVRNSLNRMAKVKGNTPKCPFCNEDMSFQNTELHDEFDYIKKAEVQKWKCDSCGLVADFEFDLSSEEYGESYRKRGNSKKVEIGKDGKDLKSMAKGMKVKGK